jgi:HTH-type transcriptional regulator, glycine betaine synthesis regulator
VPFPDSSPEEITSEPLGALEQEVVQIFIDGVKVLGLPRSIGEIYGLLFISATPLSLNDVIRKLAMSKGSASQGLRSLKDLGAIQEVEVPDVRRTHYVADIELKRLVGGFLREQILPHLDSGKQKTRKILDMTSATQDPDIRAFQKARIEKLGSWIKRGRLVLPILQKFLGE